MWEIFRLESTFCVCYVCYVFMDYHAVQAPLAMRNDYKKGVIARIHFLRFCSGLSKMDSRFGVFMDY